VSSRSSRLAYERGEGTGYFNLAGSIRTLVKRTGLIGDGEEKMGGRTILYRRIAGVVNKKKVYPGGNRALSDRTEGKDNKNIVVKRYWGKRNGKRGHANAMWMEKVRTGGKQNRAILLYNERAIP